jgi:hypothetical protein
MVFVTSSDSSKVRKCICMISSILRNGLNQLKIKKALQNAEPLINVI